MSENVEQNGVVEEVENKEEQRIFSSLEEAQANPPVATEKRKAVAKWKVIRVTSPEGKEFFVWSGGSATAQNIVTSSVGWTAGLAESGRTTVPTAGRVRALLAQLSPEDREEAMEEYLPKRKKVKEHQTV